MLISMNWISDFVDLTGLDKMALIRQFSLSTAEVENEIFHKGADLSGVVAAQIVSVENHPESHKLHLLKVDAGDGQLTDVVCGAPNVQLGMKTAFAKVGAQLGDITISPRKLAGYTSYGMCCSEKEIGISDDNSGIMVIPEDVPCGTDLKALYPIDDIIFEVDNKSLTNRPDLWGHYGMAREFSTLSGRPLKALPVADLAAYNNLPAIDMKIEDPLCQRYSCLRVENINRHVSPMAMRIRLNYCGMRDINFLADLTNYLMLEMGQPMHAFDSRKVEKIRIRRFPESFPFQTLDKVERTIDPNTLMICNGDKPVAIAGIMGACGAALLARDRYHGQQSTMLPLEEIEQLTYKTSAARCQGCQNHCMLTVSVFPGGRRHVSGNRCEKALRGESAAKPGENIFAYKRERMFAYPPLEPENAPRGEIGIPRVLNMYENYPFWATFFRDLGFRVILSPFSTRAIYELGMESIPSESECYPAKLAHGHAQWLIDHGVKTIFHPCVFYEHQEVPGAQNHFNCPIVVSYPENIKNNVEAVTDGSVRYLHPFLAFTNEKVASDRLVQFCKEVWNIPEKETRHAAHLAWEEQRRAKADVRAAGAKALADMEKNGGSGIVLAGRPYHVDPEINHGIGKLLTSLNIAVLSEDSVFFKGREVLVNVLNQWTYHARLYRAAEYATEHDNVNLVQLVSFGCGIDAITTDEVRSILESRGKLYTQIKIDEINNLGVVKIRLRSMLAAIEEQKRHGAKQ